MDASKFVLLPIGLAGAAEGGRGEAVRSTAPGVAGVRGLSAARDAVNAHPHTDAETHRRRETPRTLG